MLVDIFPLRLSEANIILWNIRYRIQKIENPYNEIDSKYRGGLKIRPHITPRNQTLSKKPEDILSRNNIEFVKDTARRYANLFAKNRLIPIHKSCEHCGKNGHLVKHHRDYTKPVAVVWLCDSCHGKEHKKLNKMEINPSKILANILEPLLIQNYLSCFDLTCTEAPAPPNECS